MPEETEEYIHIPVRPASDFVEDSFATITLSNEEGIKALIGKLKSDPDGPTHIQKYMFDKSKGWTTESAQDWVDEHEEKRHMAQLRGYPNPVITRGFTIERIQDGDSGGAELAKYYFTSDRRDEMEMTITRPATEDAIPRWKWRNIRKMHQPEPIGKAIKIGEADGLEWNQMIARIVDPQSALLVREGVLGAASVGIEVLEFEYDPEVDIDDFWAWLTGAGMIITKYNLIEISLVDHPGNYDAYMTEHGAFLRSHDGTFFLGGEVASIAVDAGLKVSPTNPQVAAHLEDIAANRWFKLEGTLPHALKAPARRRKRPKAAITPKITRAEWTTAEVNDAKDLVFAVVEPTGNKDEGGKTVPRNARHLPHHDLGADEHSDANVDLPHLRNALARANQIQPATDTISTEELRSRADSHLEKHRHLLKTEQEEEEGLFFDDATWDAFLQYCGENHPSMNLWREFLVLQPRPAAQTRGEAAPGDDVAHMMEDMHQTMAEMRQMMDELQVLMDRLSEEQTVEARGMDNADVIAMLRDIGSRIASRPEPESEDRGVVAALERQIADLQEQIATLSRVDDQQPRAPVPDPSAVKPGTTEQRPRTYTEIREHLLRRLRDET